jgi:hypothetical protein
VPKDIQDGRKDYSVVKKYGKFLNSWQPQIAHLLIIKLADMSVV